MVLGFNKKGKVVKVIETKEDEEEDEEDSDEEYEDEKKTSDIKKLKSDSIVKPTAKILSVEFVSDGIYKFVLVTNKILGQIGEEFEI